RERERVGGGPGCHGEGDEIGPEDLLQPRLDPGRQRILAIGMEGAAIGAGQGFEDFGRGACLVVAAEVHGGPLGFSAVDGCQGWPRSETRPVSLPVSGSRKTMAWQSGPSPRRSASFGPAAAISTTRQPLGRTSEAPAKSCPLPLRREATVRITTVRPIRIRIAMAMTRILRPCML